MQILQTLIEDKFVVGLSVINAALETVIGARITSSKLYYLAGYSGSYFEIRCALGESEISTVIRFSFEEFKSMLANYLNNPKLVQYSLAPSHEPNPTLTCLDIKLVRIVNVNRSVEV